MARAELPDSLAEAALDNLVNQFARPLDFLRELVQNAIDAGSPRVEIWLRYRDDDGESGVLEIHVDDFGEGMDEPIIDQHLTRLFSSTKEDDLTKIGKFGIGFTSIFAIRPDAVLLHTSRHGESWELLFHPDRSFDKVRSDKQVDGTKITLFKRMARAEVEPFVRDCRWILGWWCEHSNTPITFWNKGEAEEEEASEADEDPFARFAQERASGGPEQVNRPLGLEGPLVARLQEGAVEAVVAITDEPRYGFYNGGLTLVNTRNPEVLGAWSARLGHLAFKLKSDRLEHTLTRDNVIQDAHWEEAMAVLTRAADLLRERLVGDTEEQVGRGGELAPLHRHLAAECVASGPACLRPFADRALFRTPWGEAVSLDRLEQQEDDQGTVLLECPQRGLMDVLRGEGVLLIEDRLETRELLERAWRPPLFSFLGQPRTLHPADRVYILPDVVPLPRLSPQERLLIEELRRLLGRAVGRRLRLSVGDFGGAERGRQAPLAIEGPPDGRVFQRPEASWLRIPAFLRARCLLLNRHHAFFQLQVTASVEDLDLAAYALAVSLLHDEGTEGERTYGRLLEGALEGLQA